MIKGLKAGTYACGIIKKGYRPARTGESDIQIDDGNSKMFDFQFTEYSIESGCIGCDEKIRNQAPKDLECSPL